MELGCGNSVAAKKGGSMKDLTLKNMDKKIHDVFEKYKHLDTCLSDRAWLGETIVSQILYDLWQAIREETK